MFVDLRISNLTKKTISDAWSYLYLAKATTEELSSGYTVVVRFCLFYHYSLTNGQAISTFTVVKTSSLAPFESNILTANLCKYELTFSPAGNCTFIEGYEPYDSTTESESPAFDVFLTSDTEYCKLLPPPFQPSHDMLNCVLTASPVLGTGRHDPPDGGLLTVKT